MNDDTNGRPTRRDCLRYGGAVVGGGLLAGCTAGEPSDSTSNTPTGAASGAETPDSTATTAVSTTTDGSYSASMAPVGEVAFDRVPREVMVYSLLYADMAVAYGHGESVNSLGFDAEAGGNTLDAYYERLDGVTFDRDGLTQLNTGSGSVAVDRELCYELDADLHLVDPCLVLSFDGWDRTDVEDVRTNVGPWFGNVYSRAHGQPPEGCREDYAYYTLWEITERVASVFRARSRYAELAAIRDDLVERIRSDLPPAEERPTVGSIIVTDGTFYPSTINAPGFGNAHVRPLGATDAFAADDVTYETTYDYEAMLEVDPDVLLHQFGVASYYDVDATYEKLADHPVGSRLTAVETDRIYPSANPVQGPLMNLFQLEMTAKQLYPERFGAWPDHTHGEPYPEIPAAERLFDRDRVAAVVTGTP